MKDAYAYQRYLKDIAIYPRITPEREQKLADIIQNGKDPVQQEDAVAELIQANLRLVVHCRKEFDKYRGTARLAPLDLIAEGNVGLMKAARNYQPESRDSDRVTESVRFSTYACKCIKSHMLRAIKKDRFIHIPEHHFSYWTEIENLQRTNNSALSDSDLCACMDLSENALAFIKHSSNSGVCMLEDLGADDNEGGWSEFISSENSICPDEQVGSSDLRSFLLSEMKTLSPRTRQIISMIYFNESSPTLKDIAVMFDISGERCRQICVQGLTKLKRQMFARRHGIAPGLTGREAAA